MPSEDKKALFLLKELEAENKRLKREIALLKRELAAKNGKNTFTDYTDKTRADLEKRAQNARHYAKKSYTAFLVSLISATSVFKLYKRIVGIVKKYTLVTFSLKIATYILAAVQSSAIFVVALSVFLISLPFTFIIGYSATLLSFFAKKRMLKKASRILCGKRIAVFFPSRGAFLTKSSFFAGTVRDWRDRYSGIAIIVSPYIFSKRGISAAPKAFTLMREEEKDILIIRRHFYFALSKKILKKQEESLTEIY